MKVAIIYLCYNDEPYKYLERVIDGVNKQSYLQSNIELLIVYNPGSENSDKVVNFIKETTSRKEKNIHITILPQEKNIGFVGGNNVGMDWAIEYNFDYAFLHNGDGFLERNTIEKMINMMEQDKNIGACQPLVMLYPETKLLNTSGNNYHYLGFGYCGNYRKELKAKILTKDIAFASGSAMMLRVDLLKKYGNLDKDYFIYNEDMEYCLRLRSLGFKIVLVNDAIFYHEYEFSKNKEKYYFIERNRWMVLLTYYKLATILLILPIFLAIELGLIIFSIINGWFLQKIRAYWYWLRPSSWKLVSKKRQQVQTLRTISDRELLKIAVSDIKFEGVNSWILGHIVNPVMNLYWKIIYLFIQW